MRRHGKLHHQVREQPVVIPVTVVESTFRGCCLDLFMKDNVVFMWVVSPGTRSSCFAVGIVTVVLEVCLMLLCGEEGPSTWGFYLGR